MDKDLTEKIIEASIEVHRLLGGPGLLESIYESALCHELALRGVRTQRQLPIPVIYKSALVRDPLYLDVLVEDKMIIEVKATGKDYHIYQIQLATYLRLTKMRFGMLINFGKEHIKDGISHVMNPSLEPALSLYT